MLIVWVCIGLLVVFTVIGALLFLYVDVRIDVSHHNHDTDGVVDLRYLFGLIHVKRKLIGIQTTQTDEGPALKAKHSGLGTDKPGSRKSVFTLHEVSHVLFHWHAWVQLIRDLWKPIRRLLRRVHVEQCDIRAWVGTGDVVTTGVAYGSLWALTSTLVGRMTYLCQFEREPQLQIQANFQKKDFDTDVHCILRVRAGYAMWAALRLIRVWKRRKTDGSSHPGAHENGHGKHS